MASTLRIGDVAKSTGVAARTIRYYENVGVLPPPKRTSAGYRQYDLGGVRRVLFIRRARALGLSVQQLKVLASTLDGGRRRALRPRLIAVIQAQLSAVRFRANELELLQQELERVERRLLTSSHIDHSQGCRCLESPSPVETDR